MDLEITAKITVKDCNVIEKKICLADAIPGFDDFDFSTREGFLRDFDTLERVSKPEMMSAKVLRKHMANNCLKNSKMKK